MSQNDTLTMDKFLHYLKTLERDYSRLAKLLEQKQQAIVLYDLQALDDIMKDEQAYVLLSRGFNQTIESFRSALDLQGATLSEVIRNLPPQWQPQFTEVFLPLKAAIDTVRERNTECQRLTEEKLAQMAKQVEKLGGNQPKGYRQSGDHGAKAAPSPGSLNRSI